jgi:hypothetical protein
MFPRPLARKAGQMLAALGIAASLIIVGQSAADAVTSAPATDVVLAPSGQAGSITFTPLPSAGLTSQATFSCSVTYPYVTHSFVTGHFTWSAAVGCNISLHMRGTTALYQWGNSIAYAFGSSYNNVSSYNTSSGSAYGPKGSWGVNNNVDLFIPPGYTTTVGGGCYYLNSSTIHCTATTGPFQ